MHLSVEQFIFWGDDRCLLKEGVKTYLLAPIATKVASQLANFFSVF
jgi:hypothetical protein